MFLNKTSTYPKIFDVSEDDLIKKYILEKNVFSKYYFDMFFIDFGEIDFLENVFQNTQTLGQVFFETLSKIRSGVYLNNNNILWCIYLTCCIISESEDIYQFSYLNFKQKNIKQLYFPNYKKSTASVYEKMLVKSMEVSCDKCKTVICRKLTQKYYGSAMFGDLCEKCYLNKKKNFINRLKYLKKLILNEGKKIIFARELEKTKEILKNVNLKKMKNKNYINLLENINKTVIFSTNRKTCNICFDNIDENSELGAYKECGHTFHYNCIKKISCNQCPICRKKSDFFKLYI